MWLELLGLPYIEHQMNGAFNTEIQKHKQEVDKSNNP